ncbi:MAG: hypothetical protein AAGL09_07395 [Pseudomonadota bacterium]
MISLNQPLIAAISMVSCLFGVLPAAAQILPSKTETVTQDRTVSPVPNGTRLPDRVQQDLARLEAEAKAERCAGLEPELAWNWYPGFDWSMAKRYGNDRALYDDGKGGKIGNGIIDLPNTRAYVTNLRSYSNQASDACACKRQADGTCEAQFRVSLTTAGTKVADWRRVASSLRDARAANQCPSLNFPDRPNPAEFTFIVDGKNLPANDVSSVDICLTEGHHPIQLDMSYGDETRTVTRQIEVIDHLIVNLGDSYGAGEGAPETNYRPQLMEHFSGWGADNVFKTVDWTKHYIQQVPFFAQWADPGTKIPMTRKTVYAYADIFAKKGTYEGKDYPILFTNWDDVRYRADITMPDWSEIKKRFYDKGQPANSDYRILMDHHHAHRSSATGSSQLALHLEHHDPKSSVTYVNLAASGATMTAGVLGPYRGVYELKFDGSMGDFIPEHDGAPGLKPQIAELSEMIGDRQVDHVYLSVGGNDAGFAQVIEIFLAAWNFDSAELDGNIRNMLTYFENGKWDEAEFGGLLWVAWDKDNKDSQVGLNGLPRAYADVNEALHTELGPKRFEGTVSLIGYPDFSASTRTDMSPNLLKRRASPALYYCDVKIDKYEDPILHREWHEYNPVVFGNRSAGAINVDLDFDPHEFQQATREIMGPLELKMSNAVDAINTDNDTNGVDIRWSLIDQGDQPAHHGICGYGQYDRFEFAEKYRAYTESNRDKGTYLTNKTADRDGFTWYRSPQQGAATQRGMAVTNTGLFHPNEFGYRHVGRRMMEDLDFYGAEFTSPAYINPDQEHLFDDRNDSLREAKLAQYVNQDGVIKGYLDGSQDVQMFRIPVSGRRCDPLTVDLEIQGSADPLAILAFGPNGERVAKTPSRAPSTRLPGQGNEMLMTQTPTSSFSRVGASAAVKAFQEAQNAQFEGRFCPPESYSTFEAKRRADTGLQLTFLAEHRADIWVAVGHADNLRFDPVTGRGDNRSEMDRGRIAFEGAVRMTN